MDRLFTSRTAQLVFRSKVAVRFASRREGTDIPRFVCAHALRVCYRPIDSSKPSPAALLRPTLTC